MHGPLGAAGQPAGIEIAEQQLGLEEDQAGDPDGGRSAEDGKQLAGGDGLDEEEQEGAEKDCAGEEDTQRGLAGVRGRGKRGRDRLGRIHFYRSYKTWMAAPSGRAGGAGSSNSMSCFGKHSLRF